MDGTNNYSYATCNDSLAPTEGGEWVLVFANEDLGVNNDFYVMKYEAKFLNTASKTQDTTFKGWRYDTAGGDLTIRSDPTSEPITYIDQTQAIASCTYLGTGYKLITRAEWTTIARETENNIYNWNSGVIGSGSMYKGHTDIIPNHALSTTNTSNGYTGTENSGTSEQRRTLKLYNGELIWDLGGNVWEWNNDRCKRDDPWYSGSLWLNWTHININTTEKSIAGPIGAYTTLNGVGQYYGCTSNENAFLSGGRFNQEIFSGTFALFLYRASSHMDGCIGFRCSYNP